MSGSYEVCGFYGPFYFRPNNPPSIGFSVTINHEVTTFGRSQGAAQFFSPPSFFSDAYSAY